MIRKLSVLLGIAAVVTARNAWKDGVPQHAAKTGRAHVASDKQRRRLLHAKPTLIAKSSTIMLGRALQPSPKHSATAVAHYLTAAASNSGIAPPPFPDEEHDTLTALYHSLSGPEWHTKDGWMSSSNPCGNGTVKSTWYGVECSAMEALSPSENSSSHVTGLALPQNNLVGKLPPLHGLRYLLYLDFSNPHSSEVSEFQNSVGGTLDALCCLGNISTILLAGNNLTGSIPNCIQTLVNSTVLDLDYNAIQGTTPNELCRLRNLEELHLHGNRLQGTVPVCIGEELTALRILDYSNLNIDESIGNQLLSGTLPASLCNLEHLEVL